MQMSGLNRFSLKFKTLFQLGFKQSSQFLIYQLGLRSGYFTKRTPALAVSESLDGKQLKPNWFLNLPEKITLRQINAAQIQAVYTEADEITQGKIRFFGGNLKTLNLAPVADPPHWSVYERGAAHVGDEDIKDVWEPARFNWAVTLAKAYYLNGEERYAAAFWHNFENFIEANPVNCGPNWTSAQEVSLRMQALIISAHLLANAAESTDERIRTLCASVADHARRIPPTISYAKAQNNNHLLSEAVGLYAASLFLPQHPASAAWRQKGLRWFNQGIEAQINRDGTYAQHSANYHRLMLVLALWMQLFLEKENKILDDGVLNKLAAATAWLGLRLDPASGQVPNLGHNDGSNILPLSSAAFNDYRPVVQAASRAFRACPALPPGPWDDLCLWLDIPTQSGNNPPPSSGNPLDQLILGDARDWAALCAARFHSRPAHADQLHVDIWHKGINIALDPGTFRYNAPPPWENGLAGTAVHNTLTINNRDQMTRASKFLWLDWAQAQVEMCSPQEIRASHNGYRHLGVLHYRSLRQGDSGGWVIEDEVLPLREITEDYTAVVNWLLPDWPFALAQDNVSLESPDGKITLSFSTAGLPAAVSLDIFKAGQSLTNGESDDHLGWYSPTYGEKIPALSIQYKIIQKPPIQIHSVFRWADEPG
ncbi:heparinase II/III-like protein [Pelolinea submarina]|uniref:Heparinase II/III-like protein n=2 Tax=Pelolinea submarina TaxID=913107 RepID=A0A3E0AN40_9CHLR|nr:heparinase II/III-like protein [Pelolinea submarina]